MTEEKHAYRLPTLDLCVSVDAWDMAISSCIMGHEGGFCDKQAPWCGTALRIVGRLLRPRDMGSICSVTGQGGKNNAVLKCYPADLDGLEECGRLLRKSHWFYRAVEWRGFVR